MFESCKVSFIWQQNEDNIQGDNISDSSEKLLQSSRGEISKYVILVKGECMQSSTYVLQASASHEEHLSPWRILVLF